MIDSITAVPIAVCRTVRRKDNWRAVANTISPTPCTPTRVYEIWLLGMPIKWLAVLFGRRYEVIVELIDAGRDIKRLRDRREQRVKGMTTTGENASV